MTLQNQPFIGTTGSTNLTLETRARCSLTRKVRQTALAKLVIRQQPKLHCVFKHPTLKLAPFFYLFLFIVCTLILFGGTQLVAGLARMSYDVHGSRSPNPRARHSLSNTTQKAVISRSIEIPREHAYNGFVGRSCVGHGKSFLPARNFNIPN